MALQPIDFEATAEPLFHEEQRFTQPWVWAIVALAAAICWGLAWQVVARGGADAVAVIVLVLAGAVTPILFIALRLITEVRDEGVYIRYAPFHLRFRRFGFDEIDRIEARRYSPVMEYGGWGIRLGFHGWAYNVSGNMGVQIVMRSGKRVLIGTQRPEEFMAAVEAART